MNIVLYLMTIKWRSILVNAAGSQEGPKNPLKGITVKPMVPASYAQFGVGAEGRCGFPHLRRKGGLQWHGGPDPSFAETCYCAEAYSPRGNRLLYEAGCEPALRCVTHCVLSAVCRVACLA